MEKKGTSAFSNGLIWFGAAVSIAEILTGTLLAPLGFAKGLAAILIGHVIGCVLFYLAGLIGGRTRKSSMETVKMSFGQKGSLLFSSLNVLQLVGWTAVMIVSGAAAAGSIVRLGGGIQIWSIIIGVLIIVWVLIGLKNLSKVNIVAMAALFILTLVLSTIIFRSDVTTTFAETMQFGVAVELSVAMPLSWLPLISDYTREAEKPKKATLVSTVVYFLVSCWMYVIGMGAALFTGEGDIAVILVRAGLGIAGLIIVIFSTVTTTFLDVFSAGVSATSIYGKLNEKWTAIVVCVIGTLLAALTPITQYENFLLLISSVFAPMIAILITDHFILKKDYSDRSVNWLNLVLWLIGFVIYRIFMYIDTPIGNTVPVIIIVMVICCLANVITGKNKKEA